MKFKDKFVGVFFGDAIEKEVAKRLKAAAVTDADEEGWRRLTGNENRNLSPLKQERMIEIAFWLWENNPIANWMIEIAVAFVLAEGLPYKAKHPAVKAVLDDFWYDPLNRMDIYLEKFVRELFLYGELCFPVFTAAQTGRVRLGYADPSRFKEVVTDPDNVKAVTGIILKDSSDNPGKKYKTIFPKDAETILSRAAQKTRENYTDGECFYFAINNVTNSPRGRSELLVVADWADVYEQHLFDLSDKLSQFNTFVWDLLVENGNEEEIKKQMQTLSKKSGSSFGHNEKVKLSAISPDLKTTDASVGARLMRNHILGAKSYPEHWFGGGGDVNRATAVEMGTPAYKALSSKQRYVKFILESIFEYVIENARNAGYLKVSDEDAGAYTVDTPELASKDLTKIATVTRELAITLVSAETQNWIDKETARKIFATGISFLGIEINPEEIAKKVEDEEEQKGYEDYKKSKQI